MRKFTLMILVMAVAMSFAHAQNNVGTAYGARDPVICGSTKSQGAVPTIAEVTRFLMCAKEKESARWGLWLVSDVKIQMAGPRRYTDDLGHYSQIDISAPMYDLRGSYVEYACDKLAGYGGPGTGRPAGKNCNKFTYLHATGTCYKTKFGEWKCAMMDTTVGNPAEVETRGVPPPA